MAPSPMQSYGLARQLFRMHRFVGGSGASFCRAAKHKCLNHSTDIAQNHTKTVRTQVHAISVVKADRYL